MPNTASCQDLFAGRSSLCVEFLLRSKEILLPQLFKISSGVRKLISHLLKHWHQSKTSLFTLHALSPLLCLHTQRCRRLHINPAEELGIYPRVCTYIQTQPCHRCKYSLVEKAVVKMMQCLMHHVTPLGLHGSRPAL